MKENDYYKSNSEFFCNKSGYDNVVFTNAGLSAFHAFLLSQDFELGDEIIFPVECYPTFPMIAIQSGLTPVFVDVDEHYNLCWESLKKKITDKTKFVVVIHMAGIPAKMREIQEVIMESNQSNNIILIEDWCQAFGTLLKHGIKKESLTKAAILSFSSSKLLSIK